MKPRVSIVCISFNHAPFIEEALDSVFNQTYENIQVIVLDDGSTDPSVSVIRGLIQDRQIEFVAHRDNMGYTKTFNEGLSMTESEFVIDFALDDVMMPDFVEKSIEKFEAEGPRVGVVFSNADYIDTQSKVMGNHNEILFQKKLMDHIPEGDVFAWVLKRYFICTPTMVVRREVHDRLNGYDENLAYEDFDFWVRSSRYWEYAYVNEVLLQKRKLNTSMSAQRYRHHENRQLSSVLAVCKKAFHLCKTKEERRALITRLNYEYRQCLRHGHKELAHAYRHLLKQTYGGLDLVSHALKLRYLDL